MRVLLTLAILMVIGATELFVIFWVRPRLKGRWLWRAGVALGVYTLIRGFIAREIAIDPGVPMSATFVVVGTAVLTYFSGWVAIAAVRLARRSQADLARKYPALHVRVRACPSCGAVV